MGKGITAYSQQNTTPQVKGKEALMHAILGMNL